MKQANLSLRGAIGQEVSCLDLASTIDSLSREGVEVLTLDICSMGGSVFDGNNLISSLKSFPGELTINIDFAASMAAIIAMRPSRVRMDASGILMFHKPYDPSTGSRESEMLQKLAFSAIQEVSQNRNIPYQKLEPIFDAERWLTAQEALELGFVDEIYTTRELSKG